MGRLGQILDLIENSVPEYSSMRVVPRGMTYLPDKMLNGTIRFGKRLGNTLSVMNPDNEFELIEDTLAEVKLLKIDRGNRWLETGSLLTFNEIEMLEVLEISEDPAEIVITEGLTTARNAGESLYLWAVPLEVHSDMSSGSQQLIVRSKYPIFNKDKISIRTSMENVSSLMEVEVEVSFEAGLATIQTDRPYIYNLILKEKVPLSLRENDIIYLRAFPAYKGSFTVPKISHGLMGPFLLDYLSSPLNSEVTVEEYFSIRAFNGGGGAVLGSVNSFLPAEKNIPVSQRPIGSDAFLFWTVVKGSAGFNLPNKFQLKTDEKGLGKVFQNIIPKIKSKGSWEFKVTSSSSGKFRVRLSPEGFKDYTLMANSTTIVQIDNQVNEIDKIEMVVNLEAPSSILEISNWTCKTDVINRIEYAIVARVLGRFNYQASGVFVKPYFLGLSDLKANYNDGSTYNSGTIFL